MVCYFVSYGVWIWLALGWFVMVLLVVVNVWSSCGLFVIWFGLIAVLGLGLVGLWYWLLVGTAGLPGLLLRGAGAGFSGCVVILLRLFSGWVIGLVLFVWRLFGRLQFSVGWLFCGWVLGLPAGWFGVGGVV